MPKPFQPSKVLWIVCVECLLTAGWVIWKSWIGFDTHTAVSATLLLSPFPGLALGLAFLIGAEPFLSLRRCIIFLILGGALSWLMGLLGYGALFVFDAFSWIPNGVRGWTSLVAVAALSGAGACLYMAMFLRAFRILFSWSALGGAALWCAPAFLPLSVALLMEHASLLMNPAIGLFYWWFAFVVAASKAIPDPATA